MTQSKLLPNRRQTIIAHDIFMAAISFVLALLLRMGDAIYTLPFDFIVQGTVLFTVIAASAFWYMGLYRGIWRYASTNDVIQITKAVTVTVLVFLPVLFLWSRAEFLPRSFPVINWFVLIALLGGPRFVFRLFMDRSFEFTIEQTAKSGIPVLLVGAGDAAETFIREMSRQRSTAYRIAGILDEKGRRVGRHIHDVPVLGTPDNLPAVLRRLALRGVHPQRLIATKQELSPELLRSLLDIAEANGMTLSRLPRLTEFHSGAAERLDVRPVDVEDLLGRPQAVLDRPAMEKLISGKRVLITGAGGTIGSELTRQVADLAPAQLILADNSEYNLYAIDLEISHRNPDLVRAMRLADVRDQPQIAGVFDAYHPELVFHAAALKHVPIVESHPGEGVLTNVGGSRIVADLCLAHAVDAMVLISTDKAVNPTSVMGATKRIAESYCQALDRQQAGAQTEHRCRFITVRFGNVLGSTGSVVPLFEKQLARGGPLTVTDPNITRYFMTTREAVELVLQASAMGVVDREAAGNIFVLDMGDPVRIVDLAEQMIRLSGKRPYDDIEIEFTGLRPGEKLYEELFHDTEATQPTSNPAIRLAAPRTADRDALARSIDELIAAARATDELRCRAALQRLVPEYVADTSPGIVAAK
ncbi:MAG: NAD-dependent epimerase/dehydratase family protein [Alphaproteobacteria bacterium]|nr:NAD-dependent epimerase/dehydratase family protein [Alphaproteobacteria bacterium]